MGCRGGSGLRAEAVFQSSVQCAAERQDGGLGPAGSALLYDQGEFFRTHPVSGPSLCRGGRHRRLQVASRTQHTPCTRPHASQEREPTLLST